MGEICCSLTAGGKACRTTIISRGGWLVDRFIISGGRKLRGDLTINGAKNAVLPILAACLLCDEASIIHNVPWLKDVQVMCELLEDCGVVIQREDTSLLVDARNACIPYLSAEAARRLRASNLLMAPCLSRFGHLRLPSPGGCDIGRRPMNYHLQALGDMGAEFAEGYECIEAAAPFLHGAEIVLPFPSVGATENTLMAAVLARGRTVIKNAAREPEVVDLARFLQAMGADIRQIGCSEIVVEGVAKLHGSEYTIMPDRIETGTLLCAAAITGGHIYLKGARADHQAALLAKLEEAGCELRADEDGIGLTSSGRLRGVNIQTLPYDGFPTDLQPLFMALMTLAAGSSVIAENVFENRFKQVPHLCRMGADIRIIGRVALVHGVSRLYSTQVEATDLRAGAALVCAGLAASGTTVVEKASYVDRGYYCLEERLNSLGAQVVRLRHNVEPVQKRELEICG